MGDHAQDEVDLAVGHFFDDDDEEEGSMGSWGSGYLGPRLPRLKTCNRCGAGNLYWKELPEGWRLHDAGSIHVCKSRAEGERQA